MADDYTKPIPSMRFDFDGVFNRLRTLAGTTVQEPASAGGPLNLGQPKPPVEPTILAPKWTGTHSRPFAAGGWPMRQSERSILDADMQRRLQASLGFVNPAPTVIQSMLSGLRGAASLAPDQQIKWRRLAGPSDTPSAAAWSGTLSELSSQVGDLLEPYSGLGARPETP